MPVFFVYEQNDAKEISNIVISDVKNAFSLNFLLCCETGILHSKRKRIDVKNKKPKKTCEKIAKHAKI